MQIKVHRFDVAFASLRGTASCNRWNLGNVMNRYSHLERTFCLNRALLRPISYHRHQLGTELGSQITFCVFFETLKVSSNQKGLKKP